MTRVCRRLCTSRQLLRTKARPLARCLAVCLLIPRPRCWRPDADGFFWLDVQAFRSAVAPDAPAEETALIAAAQKPIAMKCLGERIEKAAWRAKPSWFLIAENDRMVSPRRSGSRRRG